MGDHQRVPQLQTSVLEASISEPRPKALVIEAGEPPPFRSVLPPGSDVVGLTARARARLAWSSLLGIASLAALAALGVIGIGRATSGVGLDDDPVSQALAQDIPTRSATIDHDGPLAGAEFGSDRTSRARTTGEMSDDIGDGGGDRIAPVRRASKSPSPTPVAFPNPAPGSEPELVAVAGTPSPAGSELEPDLETTYLISPEAVDKGFDRGDAAGLKAILTPDDTTPDKLSSVASLIESAAQPPPAAPAAGDDTADDGADDDHLSRKPTPTTSTTATTSTTSRTPAPTDPPAMEVTKTETDRVDPVSEAIEPAAEVTATAADEPPPTTVQESPAVDSTSTTEKVTPAATRPGRYRAERRRAIRAWIERIRQSIKDRD